MPQPPTAIYYKAPHHEMAPVFEVFKNRGIEIGKDISILTLGVRGTEHFAPTSMLLEPAEILGTELAEAAVTVAKDPTEIIQIDVPFQYVDKGSIATVGPEIERRIPENDMADA